LNTAKSDDIFFWLAALSIQRTECFGDIQRFLPPNTATLKPVRPYFSKY